MIKELMKTSIQGTHFYYPLRNAYRFAFNRRSWSEYREMVAFYRQFVSRGDLVFDVGANVGIHTEVFLALGAKVVAVEPNPDCARLLRSAFSPKRVMVEAVGCSSREGQGTLYLCDADVLGSLSREWISLASSAPRFAGKEWDKSFTIPLTTLDHLIRKYGMPKFMKIDVEGFEPEVLSGLSRAPQLVRFEFNTEFMSAAVRSISQGCFPRSARFNLTLGEDKKFVLHRWVNAAELQRTMVSGRLWSQHTHGDIFVVSSEFASPRGLRLMKRFSY